MTRNVGMPYGAFELKACYQKNMLTGTSTAVAMTVAIIFAAWLFAYSPGHIVVGDPPWPTPVDSLIVDLGPPPPIDRFPDITRDISELEMPQIGIPIPTDGDAVDENNLIPTRRQRQEYNQGIMSDVNGPGYAPHVIMPDTEGIPQPDVFVPHEVPPALIRDELPRYPSLAQAGGFSAEVILNVYVGIDGIVKEVRVAKCSRPGIGFEEAAIAAGYKLLFRPAVQNGEPIGLWVIHTIRFVIE